MNTVTQKNQFIIFSLAGDESIASTRIRYYSMVKCLKNKKIRFSSDFTFSNIIQANVLFIQKRVDQKILNYAIISKLLGKRIIYDVDDFGYALQYWVKPELFLKMINIADLITVGSESQKEIFIKSFHKNNIVVLPPVIDYYPNNYVLNYEHLEDVLKIIWFGNSYNFSLFEKYIDAVLSLPNTQLIVVTDKQKINQLSLKYPLIQFKEWSLSNFIPILRSCHLSVLTHDGSGYDQAKTNNKMITSISWGIPAIVSDTKEYKTTALQAGVGFAVYSNSEELVMAIERLRSTEARNLYLKQAQPIIWSSHSPEAVTDLFLNLCKENKPKKIIRRIQDIISSFRIQNNESRKKSITNF